MPDQLELNLEAKLRLMTADEIYAATDPDWLRLIKEDLRIERKIAAIHARDLSIIFSQFANTPPHGGIIAIGVSDEGELDGILSQGTKQLNALERTGDIYCPDAKYEVKRVNIKNRLGQPDQLLLIRVHYHGG